MKKGSRLSAIIITNTRGKGFLIDLFVAFNLLNNIMDIVSRFSNLIILQPCYQQPCYQRNTLQRCYYAKRCQILIFYLFPQHFAKKACAKNNIGHLCLRNDLRHLYDWLSKTNAAPFGK